MRLLNVTTLALEEFVGEVGRGVPQYAILSHTWGEGEVSFMDYVAQTCQHKGGYEKIKNFCRLAESEGFRYAWVDTCCIDKTSSAELSEAINSMFQWYRDAGVCYAYLEDVDTSEDPTVQGSSFASSRWFTWGWTLQELLGPVEVVFLGSDWAEIGTKRSLCNTVSAITKIDGEALDGRWDKYSVAQKMSWAAGRQTTRLEDEAYCLMGLFDINMPLLYGEGRKAFIRLQQEILKISEDQSIFAWSYPETQHSHTQLSGLLAPSPEQFRNASRIEMSRHREEYENPFEIVNRLVRIRLRLLDNVQAMKLQALRTGPTLYDIAQVLQDTESKENKLSKYYDLPAARLEVYCEMDGDTNEDAQEDRLTVPMIVIESEDGGEEQLHETSGTDSGPVVNSIVRQISVDEGEYETPDSSGHWAWYIYEPVVIAPLRCHVDNNPLGIILSKGSVEGTGLRVLSRLHNPSVVAIKAIPPSSFSSLTTTYASVSMNETTAQGYGEAWGLDRFSWPEIRISGVLSAGYAILEDYGTGWSVDAPGVLKQARKFQVEFDMAECTPLLVFYHKSSDEEVRPTFFVAVVKYSKQPRTCIVYVGLTRAGAGLMTLDYKLLSVDLAQRPRVEFPLGNEGVLVIKLREGAAVAFISLSIEAAGGRRFQGEVFDELAKKGWLNSRLFPILRVALGMPSD